MTTTPPETVAEKRIFLYLPRSVQADIEKFRRKHGIKSQSGSARALLRYATKMVKEADSKGAAFLYMPFVDMEIEPLGDD